MSSVGSSTSTIVSFRGSEMELDEALDQLYRSIQEQLNYSQCSIRQLACSSEQDDDFLEATKIHFELDDHVLSLLAMFKELQSVSKQCLGPCPKNLKEEYKKMCDDRTSEKKKEKANLKEMEKQMKLNDIKE
jgi:hypothetical protein